MVSNPILQLNRALRSQKTFFHARKGPLPYQNQQLEIYLIIYLIIFRFSSYVKVCRIHLCRKALGCVQMNGEAPKPCIHSKPPRDAYLDQQEHQIKIHKSSHMKSSVGKKIIMRTISNNCSFFSSNDICQKDRIRSTNYSAIHQP